MGKYLRKPKLTTDVVAHMDLSQSSLGVRTRAKTLALQKLQAAGITQSTPPERHCELSYLQLRSRKLEKPPCCRQQNPNLVVRSGGSGSVGPGSDNVSVRGLEEVEAVCDFGSEETSLGENNVDFDGIQRELILVLCTRESTPCSFIRGSDDITTPGSSTKPTDRHASNRIIPCAHEIEEFFAFHAQEQQRLFTEKYNFDIVNEKALNGRYEWVRVQP
ncbi:putative cyclin-dependent kinase inhibitor domain-containing protein [Helianthus annuus]|nr:putative cyclin-dependent kinase inhibitor domain-containing protein [Helianthus annuus]